MALITMCIFRFGRAPAHQGQDKIVRANQTRRTREMYTGSCGAKRNFFLQKQFFFAHAYEIRVRGGLPHKKYGGTRRLLQGLTRLWYLGCSPGGNSLRCFFFGGGGGGIEPRQEIMCCFRTAFSQGWKNLATFNPPSQHSLLVPLMGSFQNLRRAQEKCECNVLFVSAWAGK